MTITLDKPGYTTIKARQQSIWSSGVFHFRYRSAADWLDVFKRSVWAPPAGFASGDEPQRDALPTDTYLSSWDPSSKWHHALSLVLAHRRSASITIDQLLADDPKSVFGHCLRAALIVRADDTSGQESLTPALRLSWRPAPILIIGPIVTPLLLELGLLGILAPRPSFMARSSSIFRAIFSRSWPLMCSTFAWADASCPPRSHRASPTGVGAGHARIFECARNVRLWP